MVIRTQHMHTAKIRTSSSLQNKRSSAHNICTYARSKNTGKQLPAEYKVIRIQHMHTAKIRASSSLQNKRFRTQHMHICTQQEKGQAAPCRMKGHSRTAYAHSKNTGKQLPAELLVICTQYMQTARIRAGSSLQDKRSSAHNICTYACSKNTGKQLPEE
jgi:hypothetical protein